ncbi:MAG: aryl-sulfate sulfotransferase [Pseudomonadota bacterium]
MKNMIVSFAFFALIAMPQGCGNGGETAVDGEAEDGPDTSLDAGSDADATGETADDGEQGDAFTDPDADDPADAAGDELVAPACDEDHPEWTVGLLTCAPESFNGYTLVAPLRSTRTFLIDIRGRLVNAWDSDYQPGNAVYLLENGHLLRTGTVGRDVNPRFTSGGAGGIVQEFDWDGNLVWSYAYTSDHCLQHHDVEMMPDGNVLVLAWELKTAGQAIAAGRDPAYLPDGELWPDHIIEVEPTGPTTGDIVWEWHIWDHLIQDFDPTKDNYGAVAEHPELVDLNWTVIAGPVRGAADWNHMNSLDYNEELDQIILSVHEMSEIYIIDHSTSAAEAASHEGGRSGNGGDILYRWGNPMVFGAGEPVDQQLWAQHDAHWIETGCPGAGNILVFNNGMRRPGLEQYSTVDELVLPPVDDNGNYALDPGPAYGPQEPAWMYLADPPTDFFSSNISGSQRLANGNTLICNGAFGIIFEVAPDGGIVWMYVNPVDGRGPLIQGSPVPADGNGRTNTVFRAYRYAPDYPGLEGRDLTPGDYLEQPAE